MVTVGLIGEAPNDTESVKNLLRRKYAGKLSFIPMLDHLTGSMLDNRRTKRDLRVEYECNPTDIVIFIRDLDGLENEKDKIKYRKTKFSEFNSVVDKKGIFLLAIFELETLLFFDLGMFNKKYGSTIAIDKEPMLIPNPKEFLKENSKNPRYNDSHNPDLFSKIDLARTAQCRFLEEIYRKFDDVLKNYFPS